MIRGSAGNPRGEGLLQHYPDSLVLFVWVFFGRFSFKLG